MVLACKAPLRFLLSDAIINKSLPNIKPTMNEHQYPRNIFQMVEPLGGHNVPKSKSRHIMILNQLKKREDNWNNRFYVDEGRQIEASIKKSQASQEKLREEEQTPSQQQKFVTRTHLRPKPGMPPLVQDQDPLTNVFNHLKELWQAHQIPPQHRELFSQCIKAIPKPRALAAINQEAEDIQANRSFIQNCLLGVQTRENCLQQLNVTKDCLQDGSSNVDDQVQKASELITHLRILTINVVEQVVAWRQYLLTYLAHIHSTASVQIPFLVRDENYLVKMKRDTSHFAHTILAKHFQFSSRSDPFFLALTASSDKIVQFISKPLSKRIKTCELILAEEQDPQALSVKRKPPPVVRSPERGAMQPGKIRRPRDPTKQEQNRFRNSSQQSAAGAQESLVKNDSSKSILKPTGDVQQQSSKKQQIREKELPKETEQPKEQAKEQPKEQKVEQPHQQKEQPLAHPKDQPQPQLQEAHKSPPSPTLTLEYEIFHASTEEFAKYIQLVPSDYSSSFVSDTAQLLQCHQQGMDSFFLGLRVKGQQGTCGMSFFYLDKQCFNERRFLLSHFSVLDATQFEHALVALLRFFWENDAASEVRMGLYHYQQGELYGANKEITAQLKRIGFKWKIVQNISQDVRITVMGTSVYLMQALRRPESFPAQESQEPIFLQNIYTLSAMADIAVTEPSFVSPIVVASLLSHHAFSELTQETAMKETLAAQQFSYKGIRYESHPPEQFQQYVESNFDGWNQFDRQLRQVKGTHSSFLKACYRWRHSKLAKVDGDELLYTRLQNFESESDTPAVWRLSGESGLIYLLSTDDPQITAFVYEVAEGTELTLADVSKRLSSVQSQEAMQQVLLLPQFVFNGQTVYHSETQTMLGLAMFSTHYAPKLNIPAPCRSDATKIKAPFVFGIIHNDINELTSSPYLAFTVTNCVKV